MRAVHRCMQDLERKARMAEMDLSSAVERADTAMEKNAMLEGEMDELRDVSAKTRALD